MEIRIASQMLPFTLLGGFFYFLTERNEKKSQVEQDKVKREVVNKR